MPFSELSNIVNLYPQVLINVEVREKPPIDEVTELIKAIKDAEQKLLGMGRVLVRYSGTESILRVMVEGKEQSLVNALANDIAVIAKRILGFSKKS